MKHVFLIMTLVQTMVTGRMVLVSDFKELPTDLGGFIIAVHKCDLSLATWVLLSIFDLLDFWFWKTLMMECSVSYFFASF